MKKLISLVLCLLMLCGCAREPVHAEPEQPTEVPTQPVVEVPMETETVEKLYEGVRLQYWSLLSQTDPEAKVLSQAAADFEQRTGAGVCLNWLDGDEEKLAQILSSGAYVDIFEMSGSGMRDKGLLYAMDLTDLAANAQYEEKSWPVLRTQMLSRYGALKAIAYRPTLYGMFYNRETFDKLGLETTPDTWQEYLELCQLLKDSGYEGQVIDQELVHLTLELHMERALGWEVLKETMVYAKWRKNEMAGTMIQEAINFAGAGYLVKGNPAAYPLGQNRLAQSNATFVAGSNRLCLEVEQATLADVKWGVFPYPGDGPGTGLLVDADVLAIGTTCTNQEAAFAFIMQLTTGEYDQLRADVTVGIPADPSNLSPIAGATTCMANAIAQAPKWFDSEKNELFGRLWNGYYKTGIYFADQLNLLAPYFANEKSVG